MFNPIWVTVVILEPLVKALQVAQTYFPRLTQGSNFFGLGGALGVKYDPRELSVKLIGPDGGSVPADLNNHWLLTFTAPLPGTYKAQFYHLGQAVLPSAFPITVQSGEPRNQVRPSPSTVHPSFLICVCERSSHLSFGLNQPFLPSHHVQAVV